MPTIAIGDRRRDGGAARWSSSTSACSPNRISGHLRALQRAVFEYDKLGTEPKRRAVLDLAERAEPRRAAGTTRTSGALDALLVRDITFKQVSPFQVTGDFW